MNHKISSSDYYQGSREFISIPVIISNLLRAFSGLNINELYPSLRSNVTYSKSLRADELISMFFNMYFLFFLTTIIGLYYPFAYFYEVCAKCITKDDFRRPTAT